LFNTKIKLRFNTPLNLMLLTKHSWIFISIFCAAFLFVVWYLSITLEGP